MSLTQFVHRYVPPRNQSDRTLLLLHGTGGNEHDLLSLGAEISPNSGLLSPRGRVLEHGAPRFFRRIALGVFDQEDLREQTEALATFVTDAAQTYGFPPDRVMAVGYSNGANIAASLMFRHPTVLSGAVLLHAMVPFTPEVSPDLNGRSVLLTASKNDPIAPADHAIRLDAMFREYGAEVQTEWFDTGHQLSNREVDTVTQWLAERS